MARPPPEPGRRTIFDYLRGYLRFIPVLVTLIIIALVFQFLTEGILYRPVTSPTWYCYIVTVGTIAIAAVFILLLGEIDLSLAAVSQACGAIMAVLLVRQGLHPHPGRGSQASPLEPSSASATALFGVVPRICFIVTLAWLIAYSGLLLWRYNRMQPQCPR